MTIGAVVVNFRTAGDTMNCVRSLLADPLVVHIVVVDNHSGARDVARLESECEGLDRVSLHLMARNLGYSAGNNLGLRWLYARGVPMALVVNPDVTVPAGTLEALAAALQGDVVLACPVLRRTDGLVDSNGGWWSYRMGRGELETADGEVPHTGARLRTFAGACFLVDLPKFVSIGLLPEAHFLYGEEADVAMRLRKRGFTWTMVQTSVIHERGGSIGSASEWDKKSLTAHRYAAESAVLLTRRHWKRWLPCVVAARFVLVGRALAIGDRSVARAIMHGVTDGLRSAHD